MKKGKQGLNSVERFCVGKPGQLDYINAVNLWEHANSPEYGFAGLSD